MTMLSALIIHLRLQFVDKNKKCRLQHLLAHYSGCPSIDSFKAQFNRSMADDIKRVMHRFNSEGAFSKIDELVAFNGVLCRKVSEDNYTINHIF